MQVSKQATALKATPKMPKNAAPTSASSPEKGKKQAYARAESAPTEAIAVVLVRGLICSRSDIRDTLVMLRLLRKNACVLIPNTPGVRGMLQKAKDYITWGTLDQETRRKLESHVKAGKEARTTVFHLHPPRKGFGRKGIKMSFAAGGALGDRGEKMNDLLRRMLN